MKLLLSSIIAASLFFVCTSVFAQSTWERSTDQGPRIGVLVGDSVGLPERVNRQLTDSTAVLIRDAPVEIPDIENRVEWIESVSQKARRLYFFDGPGATRSYLSPILETKLESNQNWMVDRDATRALFETVILLIRARLEVGDIEEARRWMRRLVVALPAHRPEPRAVPPEVVEMWERSRRRQHDNAAVLDTASKSDCQLSVNGSSSENVEVAVAPDRSYLVEVKCADSGDSVLRWMSVGRGERRPVFAPGDAVGLDQLGELFAYWLRSARLDAVIYVGPGSCGEEEGPETCLAVQSAEADGKPEVQTYNGDMLQQWLKSL